MIWELCVFPFPTNAGLKNYLCCNVGFKLILQRDVKDLLEEFTKPSLDAIHAHLEKQDDRLDEMPTKDDLENIKEILCKLLQKIPAKDEMENMESKCALEELILDVAGGMKEVKLG